VVVAVGFAAAVAVAFAPKIAFEQQAKTTLNVAACLFVCFLAG
jgi:hypothetical protein